LPALRASSGEWGLGHREKSDRTPPSGEKRGGKRIESLLIEKALSPCGLLKKKRDHLHATTLKKKGKGKWLAIS